MRKFEVKDRIKVTRPSSNYYGKHGAVTEVIIRSDDKITYRVRLDRVLEETFFFSGDEIEFLNNGNKGEMMAETNTAAKSRGLFEIHAISLSDDKVVFEQKVVAEGEAGALYESDLKTKLNELKITRDDVHIVVREIGPVPPKEKTHVVKLLDKVCAFVQGKS